MTRLGRLGLFAVLVCSCTIGCENVDWNWDTTWWQKPRRVVRPSRPVQKPDAPPERAAENAEEPSPKTVAEESTPAAESRPAAPEQAPRRAARSATAETPEVVTASGGPAPQTPGIAEKVLPFHSLYLTSGAASEEVQPGEQRIALARAPARECAALLEMLSVPMGRSGSERECYLIYEEVDEFEAAKTLASLLDETPTAKGGSTVGAEAAFKAGVAELLWLVGQGAMADAETVDSCERHLAEAVQSEGLSTTHRWAAGLLAGRLASEYRYDYALARSYYRQAASVAAPGGLESMTVQWWVADSLVQDGKPAEARGIYEAIVRTYGGKWDKSHIVRRSTARLEQRPKS